MSIEITMPRLSDTMEVGTVLLWHVKEGDEVTAGDVLADIETDKATMELQSFDDGIIESIVIEAGGQVSVGTTIAVLTEDDEDLGEVPDDDVQVEAEEIVQEQPTTLPEHQQISNAQHSDGQGSRVSPVARRLAEDHGIDLQTVQGTGPAGRVVKRDIMQLIDTTSETTSAVVSSPISGESNVVADATPIQPISSMSPWQQDRTEPLSNMRQIIAKKLVESTQTIPHYQVTMTFDMDPLLDMRKALNEQLSATGVKLSVNDFLVRCCALGMSQHAEFNASYGGDCILYHGPVNIGIAIALPEKRGGGLVVGTIRNADQKSLRTISQESQFLSKKAKESGLTLEEMADTTFTISNLGMFGVDNFTAIINPPNSAILAVGAAVQKPVVREGELVAGHEMSATLEFRPSRYRWCYGSKVFKNLERLHRKPSIIVSVM